MQALQKFQEHSNEAKMQNQINQNNKIESLIRKVQE